MRKEAVIVVIVVIRDLGNQNESLDQGQSVQDSCYTNKIHTESIQLIWSTFEKQQPCAEGSGQAADTK